MQLPLPFAQAKLVVFFCQRVVDVVHGFVNLLAPGYGVQPVEVEGVPCDAGICIDHAPSLGGYNFTVLVYKKFEPLGIVTMKLLAFSKLDPVAPPPEFGLRVVSGVQNRRGWR